METTTQIPEPVKKQGDRAEEIHRKVYPDQYPKPSEQTEKREEMPAPGAPNPGEKSTEAAKPAEVKEAKPGEPSPVLPSEDWKQKYETLQGKYNAEVPQLHMTIATLKNRIQELEARKPAPADPAKEAAAKEPAPAPKPEEQPVEDKIVSAFKEEYPDIYEAVVKLMGSKPKAEEKPKEEKAKEEKPKEEKPPEPAGQAHSPASPTPRATFDYYLNRDVPDWKQVNVDLEFIKFLNAPDPAFPGRTKLESIQMAYDAADSTTVIGHFLDFKKLRESAPAPSQEKELSPEEKQLAPPKGGRTPGSPEPAPVVTPQRLTKFYEEARKGLWGPIDGEKFKKEEARLLTALGKKT